MSAFEAAHQQSLPLEDAKQSVKSSQIDDPFTDEEIQVALHTMEQKNQIFLSKGTLFWV